MKALNRSVDFRLTSGRKFNANCGYVSLRNEDGVWSITEGYDGHLCLDDENNPWTLEEKIELANYMIAEWSMFKQAIIARANFEKTDR